MSAEAKAMPIGGFWLLVRLRLSLLRNVVRQTAETAPLRMILICSFVLVIWLGLYALFDRIFVFLNMFREQSIVVLPYIFHIFFVAMTVLLAVSSAILAYSALFLRHEPAWLLVSPLKPTSIVGAVFLESVFFSSWALLLLGIPMMAALGQVERLPWYFYPAFAGAFLSFVPIPGAIGLFAAWAAAMWAPRSARRVLIGISAVLLIGGLAWWTRLWSSASGDADHWLGRFLGELEYLRGALLPSTWVTRCIRHALYQQPGEAALYLFITAAHAAFLSWLSIGLVARFVQPAYGRAQSASSKQTRFGGRTTARLTDILFCYLPKQMRTLVLKDVRTFLRDPLQWSQLVILLGLLGLYLAYLPRMHPQGFTREWQGLICFLNYGAVALILSTFTSRFVFPMVSMEGRQMWMLGLWPIPRASIIWAKFDFALAVTAGSALTVTLMSIRALKLPMTLGLVNVAATLSTCVGLVGLAVGLGSRLPGFHERSAARIASGLGGTLNLVASMVLVLTSVLIMGYLDYRSVYVLRSLSRLDTINLLLYLAQIALGFGTGALAMRIGVRHFVRSEF